MTSEQLIFEALKLFSKLRLESKKGKKAGR